MNLYKINYLNLLYSQLLKVFLDKDKNQLNSIASYRKHYLICNERTIIFKIFQIDLRNLLKDYLHLCNFIQIIA